MFPALMCSTALVSSDGVAEPAGWFFGWKRRSGLQMCLSKGELSNRFALDVGCTGAAVANAAIVDFGEDRGIFLLESNAVKTLDARN